MEEKELVKTKWYPGKYVGSSAPKSVNYEELDNKSEEKRSWYPGKLVSKATRRVSVSEEKKTVTSDVTHTFSTSDEFGGRNDEITGSPVEKKKSQYDLLQSVGKVRIRISNVKYLSLNQANFLVELEDMAGFFEYSEPFDCFERTFEVKDISSDIIITVTGTGKMASDSSNSDTIAGCVIVPLHSLLSTLGKPTVGKDTWRQIFPVYSTRHDSGNKFVSGFSDTPGYALNKPPTSIGFICINAEILLFENGVMTYFLGKPKENLNFFRKVVGNAEKVCI